MSALWLRRSAAKLTFATFFAFIALLLILWRTSTPQPPVPLPIKFDPNIFPGLPVPAYSHCEWWAFDGDTLYCDSIRDPDISYSVDHKTRRIKEVTYLVVGKFSVGAMVRCWGEPIGYSHDGGMIVVYWYGGRSAYIFSDSFVPTSDVGFIDLATPSTYKPWRGFFNGQ